LGGFFGAIIFPILGGFFGALIFLEILNKLSFFQEIIPIQTFLFNQAIK
jgi:hypothetical protein